MLLNRHQPMAVIGRTYELRSAVVVGTRAVRVTVQAQATAGLKKAKPWHNAVTVSGLAPGDARDMLIRLSGAFTSIGYPQSHVQAVLNFQDLPRKVGYDPKPLAMAAGIVLLQAAAGWTEMREQDKGMIICPIDSTGRTCGTPFTPLLALAAQDDEYVGAPIDDVRLLGINAKVQPNFIGVAETMLGLMNDGLREVLPVGDFNIRQLPQDVMDFSQIAGQEQAKRAAVIAAASGCALLLIGSPGSGKTTIAKAMVGIMPDLTPQEQLDLIGVYAAEGKQTPLGARPFRCVHHTASKQSVIGGGTSGTYRPGEATLAHTGVLFLDELPEFSRDTLEALRQPMECGEVVISRVGSKIAAPCRFTLVAAMNPCPCGYYGAEERVCTCSTEEVHRYQKRISGPLLDRIDLKVATQPITPDQLFASTSSRESSETLRRRVQRAVDRQRLRYNSRYTNADAPFPVVMEHANLDDDAQELIKLKSAEFQLSARQVTKIVRVSRTIADLAGDDRVRQEYAAEAVGFVS